MLGLGSQTGLILQTFESCLWNVPKACNSLLFLLNFVTYGHCLNWSLAHNRSKVGGKDRLHVGSGVNMHPGQHLSCTFSLLNITYIVSLWNVSHFCCSNSLWNSTRFSEMALLGTCWALPGTRSVGSCKTTGDLQVYGHDLARNPWNLPCLCILSWAVKAGNNVIPLSKMRNLNEEILLEWKLEKKNPSCGFCNITFSYSVTGSKASKAAIPCYSQSKPNFTRKLCYFQEWQSSGEEIHTHPCETISSVKIISKLEKIYWACWFFLH